MSRRDCLVVDRPSLDSSDRVLIKMEDFYLSWTILSESKTRFDGQETFGRKLPKRPFSCLVGHVRCTWFSPACFLDQFCDLHLPTCLLDSLKIHVQVTSCLMFLHEKEMSILHGRESVIQLTTCVLLLSFLADSSYAVILSFINLWSSRASSLSSKIRLKIQREREKEREKKICEEEPCKTFRENSEKISELGWPFLTIFWLESVTFGVINIWRFGFLKLRIIHVLQPLIFIQ